MVTNQIHKKVSHDHYKARIVLNAGIENFSMIVYFFDFIRLGMLIN